MDLGSLQTLTLPWCHVRVALPLSGHCESSSWSSSPLFPPSRFRRESNWDVCLPKPVLLLRSAYPMVEGRTRYDARLPDYMVLYAVLHICLISVV